MIGLRSLALLSISPSLAFGFGIRNHHTSLPVYGGNQPIRPCVATTVTATEVLTVTVHRPVWNATNTVTVHAPCSALINSTALVDPIRTATTQAPWLNTTSTASPCPCASLTGTAGVVSSVLGNATSSSRQSWTGTAPSLVTGTGAVGPIGPGASSVFWPNMTWPASTATEEDVTTFVTLTLTSLTTLTVKPSSPGAGFGKGSSGLPGVNLTSTTSYQPSLTYMTSPGSILKTHLHPTLHNITRTRSQWTMPSGWTYSIISSSTVSLISSTEASNPVFTSDQADTTVTVTISSTATPSTTISSVAQSFPTNSGEEEIPYGSYTYGPPIPPPSVSLGSTTTSGTSSAISQTTRLDSRITTTSAATDAETIITTATVDPIDDTASTNGTDPVDTSSANTIEPNEHHPLPPSPATTSTEPSILLTTWFESEVDSASDSSAQTDDSSSSAATTTTWISDGYGYY